MTYVTKHCGTLRRTKRREIPTVVSGQDLRVRRKSYRRRWHITLGRSRGHSRSPVSTHRPSNRKTLSFSWSCPGTETKGSYWRRGGGGKKSTSDLFLPSFRCSYKHTQSKRRSHSPVPSSYESQGRVGDPNIDLVKFLPMVMNFIFGGHTLQPLLYPYYPFSTSGLFDRSPLVWPSSPVYLPTSSWIPGSTGHGHGWRILPDPG